MKRLLLAFLLSPAAVCHASPSASDSRHSSLFLDPEMAPPGALAAGKRLADLDAGEPRTVRMFYFLPNDRPFRPDVVQRMKNEMSSLQAFYGEQMEAHGFGYRTFRLETDDQGEPLVHRVDGQHADSHYIDGTWAVVGEIGAAFDLSKSIIAVVVDISTNRINKTAAGSATWGPKQTGKLLVAGDFAWHTLAHELGHTFGMGHDFRDERYIMSYGGSFRNSLSACSAGILAVHPYFDPHVGVEWGEAPALELLSATTYPEGAKSVPIRLRVSDADGVQQVRVRVVTRGTHNPKHRVGGWELKACRGLMGEKEAVVQIDYDGVIPSGSAWGFSDLSDPKVHPISLTVIDRDGNRSGHGFDLWERSRQHLTGFELAEGVHAVAFARGGATLAAGSAGGLGLWDLDTRAETRTSLSEGVTALDVSPDGATLAFGSAGGQVQLHDLEDGRGIATLSGHTQEIRSLAFSADGRVLASGGPDGIRLWDVSSRTRTATLPGGVTSVAFSPDGSTLVAGSGDGVRLWDVETETEAATYRHDSDWQSGVNSVAFSPDGTLVASGGDDGKVRLWEVATDENVAVLSGHLDPVRSVAFSPDGTMLASGGADLAVNLWDPVNTERLAALRSAGRGANSLAFSPDGTTLSAGTVDGRIGLWDVSDWVRPRPRRLVLVSGDDQHGRTGESLADPFVVEARDQYDDPLPGVQITFAVTEGGGRVAGSFTLERTTSDANGRSETILTLGPTEGTNIVEASVAELEAVSFRASSAGDPGTPSMEGDFHTWHLPDAATVRLGKGWMADIAFSPNGELLAAGTNLGVWLYDVATSREVALLPAPRVEDIAFSPDGRTLASSGPYEIRLWEVTTAHQIAAIDLDHSPESLAFSPDGRTLAFGSRAGIELWDVATRTLKAAVHEKVAWGMQSVAFSPDGRTLAAGTWTDYSVRLWDVATTTRTAIFKGHKDNVTSVSFSPDGRTVASASRDHTVKLWDVAARSIVTTLEGHESFVSNVVFSPDGMSLASASDKVKLWDLATGNATTFSSTNGNLAFSPDGRTLAVGSSGEVLLLDVSTGSASTLATGHHGVPLSVAPLLRWNTARLDKCV